VRQVSEGWHTSKSLSQQDAYFLVALANIPERGIRRITCLVQSVTLHTVAVVDLGALLNLCQLTYFVRRNRDQRMNRRFFGHTNVHDIRLRIIRAAGPLYGAMMPRCSDGTFDARRRVHRTRSMFLELLKYTGARLRRNVCDVRFVHRYSNQWRWLQRPG